MLIKTMSPLPRRLVKKKETIPYWQESGYFILYLWESTLVQPSLHWLFLSYPSDLSLIAPFLEKLSMLA